MFAAYRINKFHVGALVGDCVCQANLDRWEMGCGNAQMHANCGVGRARTNQLAVAVLILPAILGSSSQSKVKKLHQLWALETCAGGWEPSQAPQQNVPSSQVGLPKSVSLWSHAL